MFGYVLITSNSYSLKWKIIILPKTEYNSYSFILRNNYKIKNTQKTQLKHMLLPLSHLSLSCSSSSSSGSLSPISLSYSSSFSSGSLSPLSFSSCWDHLPLVGRGDTLYLIFLSIVVEVRSLSPISLSIHLAGVFNLYSTDFFFFLYNHCC